MAAPTVWIPAADSVRLAPGGLPEGCECVLQGLVQRGDLNGRRCVVRSYDSGKGRYGVRAGGAGSILVRRESLLRLWGRVAGPPKSMADPSAGFLSLPLHITDALSCEDEVQRLTNAAVLQSGAQRTPSLEPALCAACEVKTSGVPDGGLGVFVRGRVAAGDVVTGFSGVLRGEDGAGSVAFSVRTSAGSVEGDMSCRDRHQCGQFANDASAITDAAPASLSDAARRYVSETQRGRNAVVAEVGGCPALVATREIAAGEEVLHSYGVGYWLARIRNAALLAHDRALAKACDAAYAATVSLEREVLLSDSAPLPWVPFSDLGLDSRCGGTVPKQGPPTHPFYLPSFGVCDEATGEPCTAQQARLWMWGRLGVEGFELSKVGQCLLPGVCALLMGTAPADVPKACVELKEGRALARPKRPDDELLSFITSD
eukprot:TRINITY_DN48440_c0_g1_i1.p1 TRINITY_DN48440_c0_g1~~TRINITY_DN48440_c0_g1_i1.p1  ORF type:complete len:455 (+),score=139.44 TRINITY_DN48440_c0_g1_i1:79-1365(+)